MFYLWLIRFDFQHQQKILTSALDTARQEAALYSKALVDKEAEFASYRSSHYTELQQTLSDRDRESQAKSQAEISRDQLSRQYQQNLDALNAAQSEIAQLQNKLQKKTSDFRSDATALQNRIDQLEARSREDREAVEGLEEAFRESQEAHRKRIEEYEDEIEEWREAQEETKKELAEMARNVELLTQADKMGSSGIIGIDTAADLAAHFGGPESTIASNRASKQILTEVVRLQAESGKLKAENTRLESLCRSVLRDLEEKVSRYLSAVAFLQLI
jgi:chromosome segregation ATPase